MADPITILETAYAHAPDDRTWLREIGQAVLPRFDARFGVLGMRKLGIGSRVELVRLLGQTSGRKRLTTTQ